MTTSSRSWLKRGLKIALYALAGLLVLILAAIGFIVIQNWPPTVQNVTELEAYIQKRVARNDPPALSIAVVKGSQMRYVKGFGLADLSTPTPATAGTVYPWFSLTKLVTAAAILQLYEQGKLNLDDPVSQYLPYFDLSSPSGPITIRHLLTHTSGLSDPLPLVFVVDGAPSPLAESILKDNLAVHPPLKKAPGTEFKYINLDYVILGEVAAAASGQPYPDYVQQHILQPLAMKHTHFVYTDATRPLAARGYQSNLFLVKWLYTARSGDKSTFYDGYVSDRLAYKLYTLPTASAGGLLGPVDEAAVFLQALVNGGQANGARILSLASVKMMQEPQQLANGDRLEVGLGWEIKTEGQRAYLQALGGAMGFQSEMRLYPDESLGVVVMGNNSLVYLSGITQAAASLDWQ